MRKNAMVTIVKDENVFLPVFLRYYRQFFDDCDIYIFDNDTTDGSIERHVPPGVNVEAASSPHAFDHRFVVNQMNGAKTRLLADYDTVIHADTDEIMVPTSGPLNTFLDQNTEDVVTTTGYEVYHSVGKPDLDWSSTPLLEQREYWAGRPSMCKPAVLRANLDWGVGHHSIVQGNTPAPNPELLLLHLHRIDWKTCVAENDRKAAYDWCPSEVQNGNGFQNRLVGDKLEEWFHGIDSNKTKYPEWVRSVV